MRGEGDYPAKKIPILLVVWLAFILTFAGALATMPYHTQAGKAGESPSIFVTPSYQEVQNGRCAIYTITITNPAATAIDVSLSIVKSTVPLNWIALLDKQHFTINGSSSANVILKVASPFEATLNENAAVQVVATVTLPGNMVSYPAIGTYTVVKDTSNTASFQVRATSEYKEVKNGQSATYNITLSSDVARDLTLELSNVPSGWFASLSSRYVSLLSNSSMVQLKVASPFDASLNEEAAVYVTAIYTTGDKSVARSAGTITVVKDVTNAAPFTISLDNNMHVIKNGGYTEYEVRLNADLPNVVVDLTAEGAPWGWTAAFDKQIVVLSPSGSAKLRVAAPVDAKTGDQAIIDIHASTVVYEGGEPSEAVLGAATFTVVDTSGTNFTLSPAPSAKLEAGKSTVIYVPVINNGPEPKALTFDLAVPAALSASTVGTSVLFLSPFEFGYAELTFTSQDSIDAVGAHEYMLSATDGSGYKNFTKGTVEVFAKLSLGAFTLNATAGPLTVEKSARGTYAAALTNNYNRTLVVDVDAEPSYGIAALANQTRLAITPNATAYIGVTIYPSLLLGDFFVNFTAKEINTNATWSATTLVTVIEARGAPPSALPLREDVRLTPDYIMNVVYVVVAPATDLADLVAVVKRPDGGNCTITFANNNGIWVGSFNISGNGTHLVKLSGIGANNRTYASDADVYVKYPAAQAAPQPQVVFRAPTPRTTVAVTSAGAVIGIAVIVLATEFGRYALLQLLLMFAVPLYTKLRRSRLLDNNVRDQIYKYIQTNPGENYTTIMEKLRLQNGVLAYHLSTLEREEMIKSTRDGIYRRFYPMNTKMPHGLPDLTWFQMGIMNMIKDQPGITQKEIAFQTGESRQVINYHIKIMIDAKVVRAERDGREIKCYLADEYMYEPTAADYAREGAFNFGAGGSAAAPGRAGGLRKR